MLEMIVLGAGGAVPTPTHGPPAYWVAADQVGVLVDPGPGAVIRLLRDGRGPASLDGLDRVLLTHLHLDHCADLAPLLFALHSPVLASRRTFVVAGPHGLGDYLERLRDLYGSWLDPHQRELVVRECGPGERLRLADLAPAGADDPGPVVETFAAAHAEERFTAVSLVLRFVDRQGRRLVYGGDGGPSADLVEAARDADLLVVECSTSDRWALDGHMNPTRVGELAAAANPRQVALTHQYPDAAAADLVAAVRRHWPGAVIQLEDGRRLTVPSDDRGER
ncbi:MAG: MBL fold metallo-hydrolase [Candidatus Krumholzibacteriia bacterium]